MRVRATGQGGSVDRRSRSGRRGAAAPLLLLTAVVTASSLLLALSDSYLAADSGVTERRPATRQHFVSPFGADDAPGTRARPWKSFAHAAAAARGGDEVVFAAGRYDEDEPTVIGPTDDRSAPIVFRSETRHAAVLHYVGQDEQWKILVQRPNVVLQDFVITQDSVGETDSDSLVRIWPGADRVRLLGNDINGAHLGIKTFGTTGLSILHNTIHDVSVAVASFNAGEITVAQNEIEHFARAGLILKGGTRGVRVIDNTLVDHTGASANSAIILGGVSCGSMRPDCGNADPDGFELSDAEVRANDVYSTRSGTGTGILVLGCRNCTVVDNRVVGYGTGVASASNDGRANGWTWDVQNAGLRVIANTVSDCHVVGLALLALQGPVVERDNVVRGCPASLTSSH